MKLIKETIIELLRSNSMYRDNDNKLIARIWYNQLASLNMSNINATQFLILLAENKLSSSESIRRSRQKCQEEMPELRGEKYKLRQAEADRFKQELGYNS